MTQRIPIVGVLALQGDFHLHAGLLQGLGVDVRRVRRPAELEPCQALVLPGGESTTMQRLLATNALRQPLLRFAEKHPLLGTCAGCILMARELEDAGGVEPLGLMDITVRRNAFGRQVDSFESRLGPAMEAMGAPSAAKGMPLGVFIRAPRITRVGPGLEVLAVMGQEPVAVREGRHVALTFHPEVAADPRWHLEWLRGAGLDPIARPAGGAALGSAPLDAPPPPL